MYIEFESANFFFLKLLKFIIHFVDKLSKTNFKRNICPRFGKIVKVSWYILKAIFCIKKRVLRSIKEVPKKNIKLKSF